MKHGKVNVEFINSNGNKYSTSILFDLYMALNTYIFESACDLINQELNNPDKIHFLKRFSTKQINNLKLLYGNGKIVDIQILI